MSFLGTNTGMGSTKGFKSFQTAHATLIGIELHHMLRKKQHVNSANSPVFEQFYALTA